MVCSRIQIIFQPSSSFYHTIRRSSAGGKGRMGRQDRNKEPTYITPPCTWIELGLRTPERLLMLPLEGYWVIPDQVQQH
jgi:hypothetical protein